MSFCGLGLQCNSVVVWLWLKKTNGYSRFRMMMMMKMMRTTSLESWRRTTYKKHTKKKKRRKNRHYAVYWNACTTQHIKHADLLSTTLIKWYTSSAMWNAATPRPIEIKWSHISSIFIDIWLWLYRFCIQLLHILNCVPHSLHSASHFLHSLGLFLFISFFFDLSPCLFLLWSLLAVSPRRSFNIWNTIFYGSFGANIHKKVLFHINWVL